MTFRVLSGDGGSPPNDMPAKAEARVSYDLAIRHFAVEVAANRAALESIRDGIQAVLDNKSMGYALVIGSSGSPCSINVKFRPVALAPTAARWPEDEEPPPGSDHFW